ncbi:MULTISPECIES: Cof-type HAD-IIB family hydrolase [unclassified Facklamia]|uniref:Cof-type HAD-IIB family hydrolase n=1 Tax=Aerococcaceae TaxID=186827 RepID=UPI0013B63D6B|nr:MULTISPECIES: Cof-type HAD-IIB family hydrolase [unclassified Facklamia]NEW64771.1 Cof-type HAD-IIB family hydrolase [Facklamia sp. 252]NEW68095.1 Cof-type HAD-IIB family hydrolase [Facklamia sp. 253]QQD64927.1 Cof-type HAD-IIB family hydrolase [Aerococcaceae bacterium zg-252]
MNKKIIFLDVDGTITNYSNQIPVSAIEAIRQARANGHLVYTVTGRSKAEMYQDILDIGFDGYIGGNGSYIESDDQVIFEQVMSAEDAKAVVDWLHQRGLEFYLESNSGLYASKNFVERGTPVFIEYSRYKGKENAEQTTVESAFPDMIYNGELYRDDLNKVSFILESYQDYLDAKEQFSHLKVGTWGGAGETALFGDIGVADVDKAKAIELLLEHLGMNRQDTFAFGDAKIDIPMLAYCDIGVAVDSGGDEIKAMADYITDAVDDNGIYNAFKHFGLI